MKRFQKELTKDAAKRIKEVQKLQNAVDKKRPLTRAPAPDEIET